MTDELKPCPFCGVVSDQVYDHKEACFLRMTIVFNEWIMRSRLIDGFKDPKPYSEEEMKEAYQTRHKQTCRNVYKEKRHVMDQCNNGFECSECGNVIEDYEHYSVKGTFNVCPNCGAEVADAD